MNLNFLTPLLRTFNRARQHHKAKVFVDTVNTNAKAAAWAAAKKLPPETWAMKASADRIIETLPMIVIIRDTESGHILRANHMACSYFQAEEHELIHDSQTSIRKYKPLFAIINRLVMHNYSGVVEMDVQIHGSKLVTLRVQRQTFTDIYGVNKYEAILAEDVTMEKAARRKVVEAQQFTQALISAVPMPVCWYDATGLYYGGNEAFRQWFNVNNDDFVLKMPGDFLDYKTTCAIHKNDGYVLADSTDSIDVSYIDLHNHEQNEPRQVVLYKTLLPRSTTTAQSMLLVVFYDVTELIKHKRMTAALSKALDASSDGILLMSAERQIVYANKAMLHGTDYTLSEVVGKRVSDFSSSSMNDEYVSTIIDVISSGQSWAGRVMKSSKDGRELPSSVTIIPILENDTPIFYLIVERSSDEHNRTVVY